MAQGSIGVNILSNVVGIGGSNVSAFGDLMTVNPTPVIQLDFVYGINSQTGEATVANAATVDTDASRLRLQSGTNAAGSASFNSARIARYRAGQGMLARFTAAWTSSAASSTQVVGVGNTDVGYFYGFDGTTFGISLRNGGVDSWVAQSNWNGDPCDGTGASGFNWNKTLGNVMQVLYPYLGYGNITFWVQNPANGEWILCHTIQYTNSSASVQVSNPSFNFYANITNTGNTTNLICYCGSVGVFISGVREYLAAQWGIANLKTAISTETNILTIKNATTYNTVTNTGVIRFRGISVATDGANGNALLYMKRNATLGGTPAYTTINGTTGDNGVTITSGNSIASYDIAGTTVSAGIQIFNNALSRNSSLYIDLSLYEIYLNPGETMTFSVESQAASDIRVAVNWNEDV